MILYTMECIVNVEGSITVEKLDNIIETVIEDFSKRANTTIWREDLKVRFYDNYIDFSFDVEA